MLRRLFFAPLASTVIFFAILSAPQAQENFGAFQGELIVKALPGGRNLELTHPFSFIDPKGKLWAVPAGTVVDGASIPQAFWSVIGGPFEDKYRDASVIHDHFCDTKTDSWENVHLVFYNGMRARGVGSIKAKIMYAAVYNFGPRWLQVSASETGKLISGQPILLEDAKEAILRFIAENDPSIEQIQALSVRLAGVETIEQLERVLFENANCTPVLSNVGSDSSVKKTLILCGLSVTSKKNAAIKNLRTLTVQLRQLLNTQSAFLLPAVADYVQAPTPEKWTKVSESSRNVYGLIKVGIRTVLDIDDERVKAIAPSLDDIFGILGMRATMISPILSGPPMSSSEMRRWAEQYRVLVMRLQARLTELDAYVTANFQ
jgi:hypothetical protein